MARPAYRFFDADNHYYETRDCFTRHLPKRLTDRAIRVVPDAAGRDRIWVGDKPFTFLENWSFTHANKPGALRELLRQKDYRDEGSSLSETIAPAYQRRDARLGLMDTQGLEASFLFPTLAVCVEHFMKDDPEQLYANLHAFNEWLDEDWGFAHQDRIFGVPMLSLADPDAAIAELDWVLDHGARMVHLRPAPVPTANGKGRSFGHPDHDPVWARLAEADVPVAFHLGDSGYEMFAGAWGARDWFEPFRGGVDVLSKLVVSDRPIHDTIGSMVVDGVFDRHPTLRAASIENGSDWVALLVKRLLKQANQTPWVFRDNPLDTIREHVSVTPYYEEDMRKLADLIGTEQVLFGSDWPHGEALANPLDFVKELHAFSDDEIRLVMRDNALALLRPTGDR